MKIKFKMPKEFEGEDKRLGFILSSETGDFLNFGIEKNFSKFNGYYFFDKKKNEYYKIIDEFILNTKKRVIEIEEKDSFFNKVYESEYGVVKRVPLNEREVKGEVIGITYGDKGELEEMVIDEREGVNPEERFFIGLSGGLLYRIRNYYGTIDVDLDVRKFDDFDKWGRIYEIKKEKDLIIIRYIKKKDENNEYEKFVVFKIPNSEINLKKEWIKKEYLYDKERNDNYEWFVYRAFNFKVIDYKDVFIGFGNTEEEAILQLHLIEKHYDEMINLKNKFNERLVNRNEFKKLMSDENFFYYFQVYKNYFSFINKESSLEISYFKAGVPWFLQNWCRDTLISIRPLINSYEIKIAKKVLYRFFDMIDYNKGLLPVFNNATNYSLDGTFWLVKRFMDLFFKVEEKKELKKYFTDREIERVYDKFNLIFNRIVVNKWDKENELIKVDWGETWMDTIERNYPLEIQVMFLELLNALSVLAIYLGKKSEAERFEDLEFLMRSNIRDKYFRGGILYDEPYKNDIRNNIFLAYYFYPELLYKDDWRKVFDRAILHLWQDWGGFSSLSRRDNRFIGEYTGVDNKSYHNGDSWFFMNNIAAICLYDLDYRNYKEYIDKIIKAQKDDISKHGFVGYISEISSAKNFKPNGCLAQLWSHSTFIELFDKIYQKYL